MVKEKIAFAFLFTLPGIRHNLFHKIIQKNHQLGIAQEEFFHLKPEIWKREYRLPQPVCERLLKEGKNWEEKGEKLLQEWEKEGIHLLWWSEKGFPERWKGMEPPIYGMFLRGNRQLLFTANIYPYFSRPICRKDEELLKVVLLSVAQTGIPLLTSLWGEPYRWVRIFALLHHHPAIVISDRGIRQTPGDSLPENFLLISPFSPDDVGTAASIRIRDTLILTFARKIVLAKILSSSRIFRSLPLLKEKHTLLLDLHYPGNQKLKTEAHFPNVSLDSDGKTLVTALQPPQAVAPYPGFSLPPEKVKGILMQHIPETPLPGKICHLFCGDGTYLRALTSLPVELTGIHPDPSVWNFWQGEKRIRLLIGNPLKVHPFSGILPHSFHLVFCILREEETHFPSSLLREPLSSVQMRKRILQWQSFPETPSPFHLEPLLLWMRKLCIPGGKALLFLPDAKIRFTTQNVSAKSFPVPDTQYRYIILTKSRLHRKKS
ncbi:MAG: hypothetical protein V2G47_03795 [bacterium JZ-2024 1]